MWQTRRLCHYENRQRRIPDYRQTFPNTDIALFSGTGTCWHRHRHYTAFYIAISSSSYHCRYHHYHHHHHHPVSVMELGHLLTRSGLTYPKVCHDSFCQVGNSVSLSWIIYYGAFYLHVVSSFSYIPVICPKLVLFLIFLQFSVLVL